VETTQTGVKDGHTPGNVEIPNLSYLQRLSRADAASASS
jgi:hypothetical protein